MRAESLRERRDELSLDDVICRCMVFAVRSALLKSPPPFCSSLLRPLAMSAKRKAPASSPASETKRRRGGTLKLASEATDILGAAGTRWEHWPAPKDQLERARAFIREWYARTSSAGRSD
jgi:hypothetical protein